GAEGRHLLLRHLVGHDEDALVTLHRGEHRQRGAGVAAGRLDDGAAVLEPARLGVLDHVDGDPILVAPARVQVLALDVNLALEPLRDPVEPDDGGVSDGLGDVAESASHHGRTSYPPPARTTRHASWKHERGRAARRVTLRQALAAPRVSHGLLQAEGPPFGPG